MIYICNTSINSHAYDDEDEDDMMMMMIDWSRDFTFIDSSLTIICNIFSPVLHINDLDDVDDNNQYRKRSADR